MRHTLLAFLLVAAATGGLLAQAPAATGAADLVAVLEARLARIPGTTGVFVRHLGTGVEAGVRPDQGFSSASVIKLAFLVRAFQLADQGRLDLGARVTLDRTHLRHGTGIFQFKDPGLQPTWRDLLTEMVITSDNTATDLVLMKIGGPAAVTGWLKASGYAGLQSFGRPHDYRRDLLARLDPAFARLTAEETTGLLYAMDGNPLFERYRPLFAGPKAAWVATVTDAGNKRRFATDRNDLTASDPAFWLGAMTPRGTARLLEAIQEDRAAAPASCAAMRTMLRNQQLGTRRLPRYVPVPVGHKTGDGGTIANDAGILYAPSGPIVVAVFASGIAGDYGDAEDQIGQLGKDVLDHFAR
jgi:beta-lactamase class A